MFRKKKQTCLKVRISLVKCLHRFQEKLLIFVVSQPFLPLFSLFLPLPPKNACLLLVGNSCRFLKLCQICWNHRKLIVSSSSLSKPSFSLQLPSMFLRIECTTLKVHPETSIFIGRQKQSFIVLSLKHCFVAQLNILFSDLFFLCLVLQRLLTDLYVLALHGLEFYNRSLFLFEAGYNKIHRLGGEIFQEALQTSTRVVILD